MFSLTLKDIFTLENLLNAFRLISQNSAGIDNKSYAAFQSDLNQNILNLQQSILNHTFTPEPFKRINIPKDDGKSRPISLGCVADKLVERTLYLPLCDYFDKFLATNPTPTARINPPLTPSIARQNLSAMASII